MSRQKRENDLLAGGVIDEAAMLAYLGNELNEEQKVKFESLLKGDPFAQDALEGLRELQSKNAAAEKISSLKIKVNERLGVKERKLIQMHWSAYAMAAVVFGLLIGVGFLMMNYFGNHNNEIAMNKTTEEAKKESENLFEERNVTAADSLSAAPVFEDNVKDSGSVNGIVERKADETKPEITLKLADATEKKTDGDKDKTNKGNEVAAKQQIGGTTPASQNLNGAISQNGVGGAMAPVQSVTNTGANQKASMSEQQKSKEGEPAKGKKEEQKNVAADTLGKIGYADNANKELETVTVSQYKTETKKADKPATLDEAMSTFNSGSDYKKAADQFDDVLKSQPDNAEALYFGAVSDYINGNTKKSEKNFDKLLKTNRYTDGSKWYKANILLKKGKSEEAKKILQDLSNSNSQYKERAVKKMADLNF